MLWTLLVLFQIKHFLFDYVLQKHGNRKGEKTYWLQDMTKHCLDHWAGTLAVGMLAHFLVRPQGDIDHYFQTLVLVSVADFDLHFITDRAKAMYKATPAQKSFWVALGADQMVHHLCNVGFAWVLVNV